MATADYKSRAKLHSESIHLFLSLLYQNLYGITHVP